MCEIIIDTMARPVAAGSRESGSWYTPTVRVLVPLAAPPPPPDEPPQALSSELRPSPISPAPPALSTARRLTGARKDAPKAMASGAVDVLASLTVFLRSWGVAE